MATQYNSPHLFAPKAERRSEAALQACMKIPTVGCRLKIFMGIGSGVFNGVSEKMISDMVTIITTNNYNQSKTVDGNAYSNAAGGRSQDAEVSAPRLFQETINGAHLTAGSPENLDMLRKFQMLEDTQLKLMAVSKDDKNINMLRDYIGSVVGTWGGKDEAYTQKFLKFLRDQQKNRQPLHGEEAAETLTKAFAGGGTPSQKDEDLAWRLTDVSIHRGVFFFSSFAQAFNGIIGKNTDGVVDQHLRAIRRAIDLLEAPEGVTGAVGKTFGRYADLVDVRHAESALKQNLG